MNKRFRRPRKAVVLLAYLVLLGASHVVRAFRSPPAPAPDQKVQHVEGAPPPPRGPVAIAYREWVPAPPSNGTASVWSAGSEEPAGDPLPVLLLHGSPGSGSSFRRLAPNLGAHRRALAPDLPGFGASTARVPDYSIRAHAAMALQLLDSLRVGRVHVVGFSLGGGVALEMHRTRPDRLASITLLSATGVQEHELLGDYHLNRALHGLQLFAFWVVGELVPHFGLADGAFLGRAYARNFYDTDQRPLRTVLQEYAGPMLVVHGRRDPLVPVAAAIEHHRIVPQAELALLDGDHFLTFARPEAVAPVVLDFVARAEAGRTAVRRTALPERIRAAAVPFDAATVPPATGFALWVTLVLIAAATLVSEDLACIGTGLLVVRGSLPWFPGMAACMAGIFAGDLLLYAAGRLVGRPVARVAPVRWLVGPDDLERACRWFARRSAALVLWGRFVPGTRLPTYVAAGVVRLPFPVFALWALIAAAAWTPLLVGATTLFGQATADWTGVAPERVLPRLAALGLAVLVGLRVALPLATAAGRRRFERRWDRLRRWEFWPPWLFYLPVAAWFCCVALRYRSLTLFAAANPGIEPFGGLVGESKFGILSALERGRVASGAAADRVAKTRLLCPAQLEPERLHAAALEAVAQVGGFPVVVKPDVGERGTGVSVVRDAEGLANRLADAKHPLIVQEYVPGRELGVFYHRMPGWERGRIFGITEKRQPVVVGDSRRSVARLIFADRRLRHQAKVFARQLGTDMHRVPAKGEQVVLQELGNHCLGAEFRDGGRMETPALARAVEELSRGVEGFYFGRYDLRGASFGDIQAGRFKVVELNGVSSEATNVYDPRNSLLSAYGTLFRQWSLAFRTGAANRTRGAKPPSPASVARVLVRHMRPPVSCS